MDARDDRGISTPHASPRTAVERRKDLDAWATHPALQIFGPDELSIVLAHFEPASAEEGELLRQEGDDEHDMYLVLEGEARLLRGQTELGSVGPGQYFGEVSLVASVPRPISVMASGPMRLARLSGASYADLKAQRPDLALQLTESILRAVAQRLSLMADNFGTQIKDRSTPRRDVLQVRISGRERTVRNGTPLQDILPALVDDHPVVAGLVNNRAMSLTTPLTGEAKIQPLTSAHWEGRRIYHHSLALLLMEAAHRFDPQLQLRMGASVGFAQRVLVDDGHVLLPDLAERLQHEMAVMVRECTPLVEELWTLEEARAHFEQAGWLDAAQLLQTWRASAVPLVSYGHVYALSMGPLLTNARHMTGFKVVPTDGALILVYELDAAKALAAFRAPQVPQIDAEPLAAIETIDVMSEAQAMSKQTVLMTAPHRLWLGTLGITGIGAFNQACIDGDVGQLIRVSEGYQEKRIGEIADSILQRSKDVKMVCIAGPSSSGKTTLIKRLTVQLHVNGINPVALNLDDYYVDRDRTPRGPDGDYDFEALEALDLGLLKTHLARLAHGESVTTPHYDFAEGKSIAEGGPTIQLGPRDLLLIEGIHALNPRLFDSVAGEELFRLFVCPLAQLPFDRATRVHASDVRLLRRIVRDRHGRNWNAAETIHRWPKVRRGERQHIFPFQSQADTILDSSLIYEISVLKVFAERYLLEVPNHDPAHTTAFRLLNLLDRFIPIYSDHVPGTSLLREFIGGSAFDRQRS